MLLIQFEFGRLILLETFSFEFMIYTFWKLANVGDLKACEFFGDFQVLETYKYWKFASIRLASSGNLQVSEAFLETLTFF